MITKSHTGRVRILTRDFRFRQVPTFGNGGIRRFAANVSGMNRVTADEFENILLVSVNTYE